MRRTPIFFGLIVLLGWTLAACGVQPNETTIPEPAAATSTQAVQPDPTLPVDPSTPEVYPGPEVDSTPAAYPEPTVDPADPPTSTEESYPAPPDNTSVLAPIPGGFPDPAGYAWQTVATGIDRPIDLSGDRMGRLLVADQHGQIHVIENGTLRDSPFLDITARVGINGNEQGLLGMALHPRYAENGFFYVNYTDANGDTVIARFTADPPTAVARADSEKVLLQVDQPFANHNGGGLAFGPDGYLYIGLGDGGQAGDPDGRAQNLNTLLGKMLRIDVDGGDPYSIPPANLDLAGGSTREIFASGLRNPWRFSFDSLTGDLYIGDVGQNQWEEIDFLPAGASGRINFGWDYREGANEFEGPPPDWVEVIDPVFQYPHPEGCSVSGGVVYRGQDLPEFYGVYLFGDYCTGRIWGLYRDGTGQWLSQVLFDSGLTPSSFGVDDRNEVYVLNHKGGGVILKLVKK